MKYIILLLLLTGAASFANKDKPVFEIKNINRDFVKVKPDLYMSKYEVSNMDYRNFLSGLRNTDRAELYKACLPDSICWDSNPAAINPHVNYYYSGPNFDNYPVVGVSYESANDYCNWLTQYYNQDPKRKFKKAIFKLPTKEEWIFSANSGDTSKVYTWGSGFMQNNRKQYLCNFKRTQFVVDPQTKKYIEIPDKSDTIFNQMNIIPGPINTFYPNSFGIYNMCGNVAEMVAEKGIAKGGGYDDPAYKVRISSEKVFTRPQADIGFRVAMKIIER